VLPRYHPPGHDGVVINVYANLCSSTKYMLKYLPPRIKRGTLINFGGMDHLDHELWAFEQLTSQNSIKFTPFALTALSLALALNAPAASASNPP